MEEIKYMYEGLMVRQERTIKRLWILCIIMLFCLIGTNAGWIWYESQFTDEIVTEEMQQDVDTGNGNAVVKGHIGDYYGTSETDAEAHN